MIRGNLVHIVMVQQTVELLRAHADAIPVIHAVHDEGGRDHMKMVLFSDFRCHIGCRVSDDFKCHIVFLPEGRPLQPPWFLSIRRTLFLRLALQVQKNLLIAFLGAAVSYLCDACDSDVLFHIDQLHAGCDTLQGRDIADIDAE